MLPRETTVRQLKKLRQETKGTDIGDLTTNDRMNKGVPNLQYIGNPVDHKIESWEEFAAKDSKLQTIAFKSKLVNKSVSENKYSNMDKIENVLKFKDFDENDEKSKFHIKEGPEKGNNKIVTSERPNAKPAPQKPKSKIDGIKEANEMPKYTMLGQEKEYKSNPLFGIGEVKSQEIKKITDFNIIDPHTPKERPILNAGVFIDNDMVQGYVNRIDGRDVYVESVEEPMVIKKFNIKDVVKLKKETKE